MKRKKKPDDEQPELNLGAPPPPPPPPPPPSDDEPDEPEDDPKAGRKARDEGMDRVDEHTPEDYKEKFWAALAVLAAIPKPFVADELRAMIGDPPNHPNAFSSLIGAAIRKGIIRRWRNEEVQSSRTSSHARWLRYYIGTQHPNPAP